MDKDKIIKQLKDDEQYYGEYGQQFLSNSDVKVLKTESSAKEFRSAKKFTETELKNLEMGKYFHQLLLEPLMFLVHTPNCYLLSIACTHYYFLSLHQPLKSF